MIRDEVKLTRTFLLENQIFYKKALLSFFRISNIKLRIAISNLKKSIYSLKWYVIVRLDTTNGFYSNSQIFLNSIKVSNTVIKKPYWHYNYCGNI